MKIINALTCKSVNDLEINFSEIALFLLSIKFALYKQNLMLGDDKYTYTKYPSLLRKDKYDKWLDHMITSIIDLISLNYKVNNLDILNQIKGFLLMLVNTPLYNKKKNPLDREYKIEDEIITREEKNKITWKYIAVHQRGWYKDFGYRENLEEKSETLYLNNEALDILQDIFIQILETDILTSLRDYFIPRSSVMAKEPLSILKFIAEEKTAITVLFLFQNEYPYKEIKELSQNLYILINEETIN